jgi:hemerythrin superfamily protein
MNAIKLLMQDHKKVRQLLTELEGTTTRNTRDRERLVHEIETEVTIHAQVEEEIFYPAFKAAAKKSDDTEMFFEAAEEHHVVEMVMPELVACDPSTDEFTAKAKVLKELIEHHAGEEEKEMFKRAKVLMDEDELEELGTRLEERKMELSGEEPELVGAGASSGRARNGATAARSNGARASRSTTSARASAPKTTARPTTRAASTGRGTTSRKRK